MSSGTLSITVNFNSIYFDNVTIYLLVEDRATARIRFHSCCHYRLSVCTGDPSRETFLPPPYTHTLACRMLLVIGWACSRSTPIFLPLSISTTIVLAPTTANWVATAPSKLGRLSRHTPGFSHSDDIFLVDYCKPAISVLTLHRHAQLLLGSILITLCPLRPGVQPPPK